MKTNKLLLKIALSAIVSISTVQVSRAVPYASGISEAGGTVTYYLNEAADDVKVVLSNPDSTLNLGPQTKGVHTFSRGAAASWKIQVTKSAPKAWTQISDDSNPLVRFYAPRGIAVNHNPASPYFGRIYVLESAAGTGSATTATPTASNRTVNEGVYILNPDTSDAVGQGNAAKTAGLESMTFNANSTVSAFRIEVGEDDNLYISDDYDPQGGIYRMGPNGNSISGPQVLDGIGVGGNPGVHNAIISSAVVKGSLENGNLTVWAIDETWDGGDSLLRWDIGAGPLPYTGAPVKLNHAGIQTPQAADLAVAPDGNFYTVQYRGANSGAIRVISPDGQFLWNSVNSKDSSNDIFYYCRAITVSPDGTKMAVIDNSSKVWIVGLTNGPTGILPDIKTTNYFQPFESASALTTANTGREVAFDAAGNLYAGSSSTEKIRIFSPGGTTTATTGSDGTFAVTVPPTMVSVTASPSSVNEGGTASFTLTRTGNTASSLTVTYSLSGTATNGVHYTTLPNSITFAPGAVSTNVIVNTISDSIAGPTRTIILNISNSVDYAIGTPGSATLSILDNAKPELSIVATQPRLLEGYSFATATFQIRRLGLLSGTIVANVTYSGSATRGVDFNGPLTITLPANATSTNFNITPIDNKVYNGNRSIIVTLANDVTYNVGSTNSATATLIDDETPPGTVLFADNFDTDSSGNWNINSVDGGFDTSVEFGFDYGQSHIGIPPAPHTVGGTTKGVRLRSDMIYGAITGVSISPANLNLTGDYRLTFDMWFNYNGPLAAGGAGSTTSGSAGIATSGYSPQWSGGSPGNNATQDGIWFGWNNDGDVAAGDAGLRDFNAYAPDSGSPFPATSGVYAAGTNTLSRDCADPFYAVWGRATAPAGQLAAYPGPTAGANQTGTVRDGALGMAWHTIAITKQGTNVTWAIDGVTVATVNITPYLPISEGAGSPSGYLLGNNISFGHDDAYKGISDNAEMNFLLIDNVKVETIVAPNPTAPVITGIQQSGTTVVISFVGGNNDTPSNFSVVGTSTLSAANTFTPVSGAVITGSAGAFQATVPISGDSKFFRIQR